VPERAITSATATLVARLLTRRRFAVHLADATRRSPDCPTRRNRFRRFCLKIIALAFDAAEDLAAPSFSSPRGIFTGLTRDLFAFNETLNSWLRCRQLLFEIPFNGSPDGVLVCCRRYYFFADAPVEDWRRLRLRLGLWAVHQPLPEAIGVIHCARAAITIGSSYFPCDSTFNSAQRNVGAQARRYLRPRSPLIRRILIRPLRAGLSQSHIVNSASSRLIGIDVEVGFGPVLLFLGGQT